MDTDETKPAAQAAPGVTMRRVPRKTLPVALLVEGRRCIVVGGGPVAARKAEALLDAGAEVLLVAPQVGEQVERLRERHGMTVAARAYDSRDLDRNPFLVVTATSDADLNRGILDACHARGVLCACPDRGWEQGDLISPASFRIGDLTVSVSTGGAACRRSRLIKESLARHAEALGRADLLVLGTDHRHADQAGREGIALAGGRLTGTADELRQLLGLHEFMLLNTCNRVELVALATCGPALLSTAAKVLGLDRLAGKYYALQGVDAFRHLACVTAGLLSQAPRETHIRAQVKDALDLSSRNGWSGGVLHDWVGRALRIGSEINRETRAVLEGTEIEDRCVAFLADTLGDLRGRRILVVGSGAVGTGVARALLARGAAVAWCYHSRVPNVVNLCGRELPLWSLADLREAICDQTAIVCAVAAPEPVLAKEQAAWFASGRPVRVIDLGAPRNVAPGFESGLERVKVTNLDDLHRWGRRHAGGLEAALAIADRVVMAHAGEYERVRAGIQGCD